MCGMVFAPRMRILTACLLVFSGALFPFFSLSAFDGGAPVHGLWVWKSADVLAEPRSADILRDFCKSQGINEVYVSVSARSEASEESRLAHLIRRLTPSIFGGE